MSMTYSIACLACKQRLWVGQGTVNPYLYGTPEHRCAMEAFLLVHRGHLLIFGDDEQTEVATDIARREAPQLFEEDMVLFGTNPVPSSIDMRGFLPSDIPAPLFTQLCADHEITADALRDTLVY